MIRRETNEEAVDPAALALQALGWTLSDEDRAGRFLALTGIGPDDLRAGLTDPALLAAVFKFLEGHEPDLIACAEALEISPAALVDARRRLEA